MFSLPVLIKFASGGIEFKNGSIVKLPLELIDKYRIEQYNKITQIGWGISEFNYRYYSSYMPSGDFVIIPGLIISDDNIRPTKKFYGYATQLTRQQVEQAVLGMTSYLARVVGGAQRDLAMLIHDLRALSNAIYSPAEEARIQLGQGDIFEASKRIQTVLAAQGILKMRTDALDFAGNVLDSSGTSTIHIFRKIDKVQRCYKSLATSQGKSVSLSGNSYRKALGHDVFELVPYSLIDNAVKYSPIGYDINVHVSDSENFTQFEVRSYGPRILDTEREAIFEQHVRGMAAVESKTPGTGLGLNMAKRIIEQVFDGKIVCEQDNKPVQLAGVNYHETAFIVTIPSFL